MSLKHFLGSRKGQVWITDFMISIVVFSLLLGSYFTYLDSLVETGEEAIEQLLLDTRSVSDAFVSEGYPRNWTADTVTRIGLTDGDYRLNTTKLHDFISMDYNQTRNLLGTHAQYYFYLTYPNGTRIVFNNSLDGYGVDGTATNAPHIVQAKRLLYYNGSIVVLNLEMSQQSII